MPKRKQVTARRRPWKRIAADYAPRPLDGEVVVQLSNGLIVLRMTGPENEVEPIADRFLRELP